MKNNKLSMTNGFDDERRGGGAFTTEVHTEFHYLCS